MRAYNPQVYSIGVFECPDCHYIYKKKGNYNDNTQNEKIYIEQYGEVWDKKLIEVCKDKDMTIGKIKDVMGCSRGVVLTQMRRLGIDIEQYSKKTWLELPIERIQQAKEDVMSYLVRNKNALRNDVREELSKQWDCLEKYDREWLYANIPANSLKWQGGKDKQKKFWLDKDNEMHQKVGEYIDNQIRQGNSVNKKKIAKQIGYYALDDNRYKDKLPKTYHLMEMYIQDNEAKRNKN